MLHVCPLVGMVTQFPQDYMHLVLLGVMRKILCLWMTNRWSRTDKNEITEKLVSYRKHCPSDMARRPRELREFRNFKATELRTILCYTGLVAFRNNLSQGVFRHFLLLVCSLRILLNPVLCKKFNGHAKEWLIEFVKLAPKFYGPEICTFNMHGLCHLADEGQMYGNLDNISSFPFENKLCQVKNLIKRPGVTLRQIINRTMERRTANLQCGCRERKSKFSTPLHSGTLADEHKHASPFRSVTIDGTKFSTNLRDSCFVTNGKAYLIEKILKLGPDVLAIASVFEKIDDLFKYPCASRTVGIYKVWALTHQLQTISLKRVQKSMMMPLPTPGFFVVVVLNSHP